MAAPVVKSLLDPQTVRSLVRVEMSRFPRALRRADAQGAQLSGPDVQPVVLLVRCRLALALASVALEAAR